MKIITHKFKQLDFNDLGDSINNFIEKNFTILYYEVLDIEIHKLTFYTYDVIFKVKQSE